MTEQLNNNNNVEYNVKNLPAMQETQVQSPGQEDPVEEGVATRSSVLAWRIPWTEEPGGRQSPGSSPTLGSRRSDRLLRGPTLPGTTLVAFHQLLPPPLR